MTPETNTDILNRIDKRLQDLTSLVVASIPSRKLPAKLAKLRFAVVTPSNLLEARMDEMERAFKSASELDTESKISQNFPLKIVQPNGKPPWEIVPVSILLNRAAQRRVFAPVFEHGEMTSMENAKNTLESMEQAGKLVLESLDNTNIQNNGPTNRNSKVHCAFSVVEAKKRGVGSVKEVSRLEEREEEREDDWEPTPVAKKPSSFGDFMKKYKEEQ